MSPQMLREIIVELESIHRRVDEIEQRWREDQAGAETVDIECELLRRRRLHLLETAGVLGRCTVGEVV